MVNALAGKVLYSIFLLCAVGFFVILQAPKIRGRTLTREHGRKVRLHKASAEVNPLLDHIPFDPKVAEAEQKHDDEQWEKEYFRHHEEAMRRAGNTQEHHDSHFGHSIEHNEVDHGHEEHHEGQHEDEEESEEEYLVEGENFDISERLDAIFPLIDLDVKDGSITQKEMTDWLHNQARKMSFHRTDRELEITDANKDGHVTFKEYLHDDSPGEEIVMEVPDDPFDWRYKARVMFPLADKDKDGKLNRFEFNDLTHPEDSDNEDLHQYLREQEMRSRDKDHDNKLTYLEFYENMLREVHTEPDSDEYEHIMRHIENQGRIDEKTAREKFHSLDADNDGYISVEELKPVMRFLLPGELEFAEDQSSHMLTSADDNKDGKLSLEELKANPEVFYNMAQEGQDYHDEF